MISPIFASSGDDQIVLGSTEYLPVYGGRTSGVYNTEASVEMLVSSAGTIVGAHGRLEAAPGASQSMTFTLRVNGADTDITFTISGASATTGSDEVNTVAVSAGDRLAWKVTSTVSVSASGRKARMIALYEGDTDNESLIMGRIPGLSIAQNRFFSACGFNTGDGGTTEPNFEQLVPAAGTIKNLYFRFTTAPGAGKSIQLVVRKNGSDTALTTTISDTATTGNDTANSFTVAAGDLICISTVLTGGPTAPEKIDWGMTFVADVDGETPLINGHNGSANLSNSVANYGFILGHLSDNNLLPLAGEYAQQLPTLANITFKDLYCRTEVGPGTDNDWIFTLRKEDADTALTATISDAATTANDQVNEVTGDDFDMMSMEITPVSNPTTTGLTNVAWGVVAVYEEAGGGAAGINLPLMGVG